MSEQNPYGQYGVYGSTPAPGPAQGYNPYGAQNLQQPVPGMPQRPGVPQNLLEGPTPEQVSSAKTLATISLVLGCLGLISWGFLSIPGLVLAIISRHRLRAYYEDTKIATAGFWTSIVMVALFALILGLYILSKAIMGGISGAEDTMINYSS